MVGDGSDESPTSNSSDGQSRESTLSELAEKIRSKSSNENAGQSEPGSLSDLAESIREQSDTIEKAASQASNEKHGDGDSQYTEWDLVDQTEAEATDVTTDPETEALLNLISDSSNILIKGPENCAAEQSLCSRLLVPQNQDSPELLFTLFDQSPTEHLSYTRNYMPGGFNETAIIDVQMYNGTADSIESEESVTVHSVTEATDLRRIGILTSKITNDWSDSSGELGICFHSLSALLDVTRNTERIFRFLHILCNQLKSADVRAHYHIDPNQHDDSIIGTVEPLFDTVLHFDESGSMTVE